MAESRGQSKQVLPFPATISRGPLPALVAMRPFYTSRGYLSTDHLRRLGNWGLPGACKVTLIHQMTGIQYRILNEEGEEDRQTEYCNMLIDNANDGIGGPGVFLNRFADDIVNALQGGLFECVRTDTRHAVPNVPVAIYNVDASTIIPTFNKDTPFYQKSPYSVETIPFTREEMCQVLWYPFVEIEKPNYSRTPVQLAYTAISILADGDDYNTRLLKEMIPQALLNLGKSFDREKAMAWKADWDHAKEGGRLHDLGLLYDTEGAQLLPLQPPPKDMGFENLEHWYSTVVAACFEMSILDLGVLTKVSTKAAAESQERVSKRQGLKHLMQLIKYAMELYLLPEGYQWVWDDIDPTDEKDEAEIKRYNAISVRMLCEALGPQIGPLEAARQGLLTEETRQLIESMGEGEGVTRAAGEGQGIGGPRQKEGGTDTCICPECGYSTPHQRGTACANIQCPKCKVALVGEHAITKAVAGFENLPIVPLSSMMVEMEDAVRRLMEALQAKEITVATFQEGMGEILEKYYFQVYESVGGEETPEATDFVWGLLAQELEYLAGFASDLRNELDKTDAVGGKAAARAKLYGSHLNSAWQRILVKKLPPVKEEIEYIITWHLTPGAEHCNTCLMMAQGGPYTLEQLEHINIFPGHNTDCLANCMCYLTVRTRKRIA